MPHAAAAEESPFQERNLDAVQRILHFTDYFRFPHVLYFDSIPDLLARTERGAGHFFSLKSGLLQSTKGGMEIGNFSSLSTHSSSKRICGVRDNPEKHSVILMCVSHQTLQVARDRLLQCISINGAAGM